MKVISRVEEKVIRAAARAHRKTGMPITTHATVGTMGVEQVEILEEEGADLQHVVIGHCALNESFAYCETIIKHGASVGFDTIGKERFDYVRMSTAGINRYEFEKETYYIPDQGIIERILALVKAGYASHIVLSSDMTRSEAYINPDTFGSYGYSYLLARFVPRLHKVGVNKETIHQMLVENPQRILGVHH
jgi:phosphotriesterase-related protein